MPVEILNAGQALLLIIVANSVPWAIGRALGPSVEPGQVE
jgi:hypothetical protein